MSEIIREKILHLTSEEIPHAIGVNVDRMIKEDEDRVRIEATIYVERDSQKGIVIGKGGKSLKKWVNVHVEISRCYLARKFILNYG